MAYGGKTLIGIVGYSPVVDRFPLGPRLMGGLTKTFANQPDVVVENMTWGPMHIVQRFQDDDIEAPDRLILVGAAAVCRSPGRVQAFRWTGGPLSEAKVQERVYEAVTGIVDIENTLMIGSYFRIWPRQCFTVEADIPAAAFGQMVICETQGHGTDDDLAGRLGFSPERTHDQISHCVVALSRQSTIPGQSIKDKSTADLAPFERFTFNHVVAKPTPVQAPPKDPQG